MTRDIVFMKMLDLSKQVSEVVPHFARDWDDLRIDTKDFLQLNQSTHAFFQIHLVGNDSRWS